MRALTALSGTQRSRALERFRLLRPHLQEGVPLSEIAREQGVTQRTLERWVARYRSEGLAGPGRRRRIDSGYQAPSRKCGASRATSSSGASSGIWTQPWLTAVLDDYSRAVAG